MTTEFDFSAALVSIDSQEDGCEFEVLSDDNKPTGFFIRLAGPDSKRRKKTKARLLDYFLQRQAAAQLANAPKNRKQRRLEASGGETSSSGPSITDLQLDDAIAATISWRFPKDKVGPECTPENVRQLYTKHATLLEQVQDNAENLDLFSKR